MEVEESKVKLDPEKWVERYGDLMMRFAIARVSDRESAEDLVQESLYSAVKDQKKFKGRSSESTWLIGILKHKIVDHYRRSRKEVAASSISKDGDGALYEIFDGDGHLREPLFQWAGTPEETVENQQFWEQLNICIAALPDGPRRAFILKEIDLLPSKDVCAVMNITPTNLWVLLHRAREKLRRCLEINWFNKS